MITLADIRDWLKSFGLFDSYFVGRLDAKKINSLGVYSLADTGRREVIGGLKTYDKIGVSLLIHGNTNKTQTEKLARTLYGELESLIYSCDYPNIAGKKVFFIELLNNQPVDVAYASEKDNTNVYEYVIELNFYFEK